MLLRSYWALVFRSTFVQSISVHLLKNDKRQVLVEIIYSKSEFIKNIDLNTDAKVWQRFEDQGKLTVLNIFEEGKRAMVIKNTF